ncbi:prolyl oligopeptidase family serine peptidase [Streptantibioticus silvisoli]|uniref:Prolyl oligopeptidase family serine peptidase n=1 Tax=Streptantibioticus silvisoli TaxID=2705255 RepID=A0ABT6VY43_9ACTN|nr:prolyl oligopeptidase family serine peptidase [Streptantibioticus silvisoli]MDI5963406.1 prolyl oligopeptidase family serine peptidase [Streptantibioticus silvisoli]
MTDDDPYAWLEDVTGETALAWVRARSEETTGALATGDAFDAMRERLREVLDAEGKIPYVTRRAGYLYNFWRDAAHPRGLWRRTTLAEYRKAEPAWDVVIDVGELAREDGENWVWQGARTLRPDHRRALVHLSRGGSDAAVVREYDMDERRFVSAADGGFRLEEADSRVAWIDADHLYVATDFGPGTLTDSGYPRVVKMWTRGTPLEKAETVFEGRSTDIMVVAHHDATPGFERDFVNRSTDFWRRDRYLRTPEGLTRVDVPEDASVSVHREWLLVRTCSPWATGGTEYPAGVLLATGFDAFMAGERDFTTLFAPDGRSSLEAYGWTRGHLLLTVLRDVRTELIAFTPADGTWSSEPLPGAPGLDTATITGTSPDEDDEFHLVTSGFTTPPTLSRGVVGGQTEVLKRAPAFFDANGITVEQHFATSDDGTRVPYFVVGPRDGRSGRTLMTGYGGFEVSRQPEYNAVFGRGWLERGGTFVLANIRGGGEYGPEWHTRAIKADRHKVYEDFAAVARDLVRRGVCTASELAIQGGSNGGLLMGVMLTRYPELFGAIACQVPLLDMKRYHKLLAGASWTAEYGNPDIPEEWEWLRAYSPYHNLDPQRAYPPVLFATSTRDDRVHPGHARKMAAAMLEQGHPVHYYENTEGGHSGASNNAQNAFRWAMVLDFLWQRTGASTGETGAASAETGAASAETGSKG